MKNTIKELKVLPLDVQKKVAKMVGGGFGCTATVELNDGKYDVASCDVLRNHYSDDHKVWWFDKATVVQDADLKKIVDAEDAEYERWANNEGRDFDWEAFAQ